MALHPEDKEFCEQYMRELEEKKRQDAKFSQEFLDKAAEEIKKDIPFQDDESLNQICMDAIDEVTALGKQILEKKKIIEKMKEVLKFYADEDNFTFMKYNGFGGFEAKLVDMHFEINGQPIWEKARQCLEETKGESDEIPKR